MSEKIKEIPLPTLKPFVEKEMRIKKMKTWLVAKGPLSKTASLAAVKQLVGRIEISKGYLPPIINETTGNVLGSCAVLNAFYLMGYKEVFVILIKMSLKEEQALSLAL